MRVVQQQTHFCYHQGEARNMSPSASDNWARNCGTSGPGRRGLSEAGKLARLFAWAAFVACGGSGVSLPPAPIAWGPTTTLAVNAATSSPPLIAIGTDGVATACWGQSGLPGALPADAPFIGYARSKTGTGWSTAQPSPILGSGAATQLAPIGAGVPTTEAVCAFRQRQGGPDLIRTLVLTSAGAVYVDGLIGALPGGSGALEQLAFASNLHGSQALAWVETAGGTSRVLFSMRLPGTGWTTAREVQSSMGVTGDQPALAIDSSDRVMLAWREGGAGGVVRARTVTLTGAAPTLGDELRVDQQNTSTGQQQPRLASTGDGEFVALWVEPHAGGIGAMLRSNRFASSTWSPLVSTLDSGTGPADQIQVHAGAPGSAVAVWRRGGGAWASRMAVGKWAAPTVLASGLAGTVDQLTSAGNGLGDAVAVWVQRSASDDLYYSRYSSSTGDASAPSLLETGAGAASNPSIALNAAGVAAVAWLQRPSGQSQPDVLARIAR
jgi:hypothetical protein